MTKILVHLTLGPTSISPRSNEGNSLFNIYPILAKKSARYHDSQLTGKALIPCWRLPESTSVASAYNSKTTDTLFGKQVITNKTSSYDFSKLKVLEIYLHHYLHDWILVWVVE